MFFISTLVLLCALHSTVYRDMGVYLASFCILVGRPLIAIAVSWFIIADACGHHCELCDGVEFRNDLKFFSRQAWFREFSRRRFSCASTSSPTPFTFWIRSSSPWSSVKWTPAQQSSRRCTLFFSSESPSWRSPSPLSLRLFSKFLSTSCPTKSLKDPRRWQRKK